MLGSVASFAVSVTDFNDISANDWFYDSVKYVVSAGLYNGTSTSTFSPSMTMTRAMFITVLARYEGVDKRSIIASGITNDGVNVRTGPGLGNSVVTVAPKGSAVKVSGIENGWYSVSYNGKSGYIRRDFVDVSVGSFTDIPYDEYYSASVLWGAENKLMNGTSGSKFSPDQDISREEMCSVLYNYAKFKGVDMTPTLEKVKFIDDSKISSGCYDAVYSLQRAGLINGNPDGTFAPKANAQRSEVAAIFHRYTQYLASLASPPETEVPDTPYVPEYFELTVPGGSEVSEKYFDDACFIGHSLAVGMDLYTHYGKADFYAVSGISVDGVLNKQDYEYKHIDSNGEEVTDLLSISELLTMKEYGKVYIFLGVNELGPKSEHAAFFYKRLTTLVELVRSAQPGAVIYLMSLTPISKEKSELSESFNKNNALVYNELIKQVCRDQTVYYLDLFGLFCDEYGYLPSSACTTDGIHLLRGQYQILRQYLMTHTM